jgi:5-methyltetrahydropteroyltriglutamate--homocysteine methyltransferase
MLTTHVGTLPRPAAFDAGEMPLATAVVDVVRRQAALGLDVVDDGEFGKASWTGYAVERLGGFEARPIAPGATTPLARGAERQQFGEFYDEATRSGTLWYSTSAQVISPGAPTEWVCTAPITYTGQNSLHRDIANLTNALETAHLTAGFLPVAAPASLEPNRRNEYYPTAEAYVFAIADAMKTEYHAIVEAGLTVQVDDAWLPALWDRIGIQIGLDAYRDYCRLRIDALNHALAGLPLDRIRYHICWGSWHGPHITDIPLADILDLVLRVNAGAYLFEAGNVRHEHEYHLWETAHLPDDRVLIPGVVSHATNVVEHPDLVAERLTRFAERVGRERVMAGTDCGLGGRVHPQLAWAKLEALVEGARRASARLWPSQ